VTAFAAILSQRGVVERADCGTVAAALAAVYGTRCDMVVFDGCILLAAPMVLPGDEHLFTDSVAGIAATGQVLLEDRRSLSSALGLPEQTTSLRLAAETYRRRGEGCTSALAGEFALAVWNDREHSLLCARDGLGLRPLFIATTATTATTATAPDLIVVSNVLTAARAHPRVPQALDRCALAGFLATGGIPVSRTAYRAIVPLPPGHTLIVHGSGRSSLRRHWSFPVGDGKVIRHAGEVVEGYRSVLETAVGERAAARTSVLMSGGIDSTSIAAAARAVSPDLDLHAFTAVYRRATTESELPRARLAAAALGIPLTPVDADTYPALGYLAQGAPTPQPLDEPTLDDWRALAGAAARHSAVALYGEDGDALFLPPPWRAMRRRLSRMELLGAGLRFTAFSRRLPYLGIRLRERFGLSAQPRLPRHPPWLTPDAVALSQDEDAAVLGHATIALPPHPDRPEVQARLSAGVAGYLAGILTAEVTGHPIELRCPLLDSRVIRFVMNVAPIPWCQRKHLPRVAYADVLPRAVVRHPKQGVGGLDAALARDWQARSTPIPERRLAPPIADWIRMDDWQRALESPDAQRVGEAWRVLQLAAWICAQTSGSRAIVTDPSLLSQGDLQNRPCIA
jgi:asparagine synthase (glutamine-hydrolysing)